MPDVRVGLDFLASLTTYRTEQPFIRYFSSDTDVTNISREDVTNLSWQTHEVDIKDVRTKTIELTLESCGFKCIKLESRCLPITDMPSWMAYARETERTLKDVIPGTEDVVCFDVKLRRNRVEKMDHYDLADPLLIEGPPVGAHNYSAEHVSQIIRERLRDTEKESWLAPSTRFQIINTWRPLNAVVDDRPLAFCDFRSINPTKDLELTTKVYPHHDVDMYYLHHNPRQQWHWISGQTRDELLLMKMYDNAPGIMARYCPHVSFHNPLASESAPSRESVETRSIVISRK